MFYVPDGTHRCGLYTCEKCGSRFLDIKVGPSLVCPYCGEEPDMEIGPDEEMPVIADTLAMGTPHEINYTLTFYSDSIGMISY